MQVNLSLEYSTITLNDIVSLVIDYRGKTPKKLGSDWSESGIRALSAKNIKTGQIIREDAIRYVDTELYHKWMKDEIKRNDILITSEAPFGEVFFWDSDEKIVLSQRLFGIRCDEKKVDPKFIYFYMTSEMFQWELQSRATGTTVKGLRQPELLKCEIQLPNIDYQRKISYILSNIEHKINVLKKLNINLDKTIRTLYNSWFVNFLPFQNQEFEDTYMGKIPKNWEIKNLNEVCDKISDSYKPDSEKVVLIQTSDVSKGKVLNHEKVPNDDYKGHFKYKFEKNDILYTQIRPKNERYAFINFNPINYVASTQLMVLRAKPNIILPYILYLFLTSRDMIMEVNLLAESRSGTFPQINFNEIKHEKVIVAPFEVYEEFWNIIKSLVEKKFIIDEEIIKLTQLRDTLLPKLMSGEIDVSKINCDMLPTSRKNWDNEFTSAIQNNLIEVIS